MQVRQGPPVSLSADRSQQSVNDEGAPVVRFQQKFDFVRDSDPRALQQLNQMFANDPILEAIKNGERVLSNGKGEHVRRIQNALILFGYDLPVYGADSSYGRETSTVVREFQTDSNLEPTGAIDRDTLMRLSRKADVSKVPVAKYPNYERLYEDGILEITIGAGYDEGDDSFPVMDELEKYFAGTAFRPISQLEAELLMRNHGIVPPNRKGGNYYLLNSQIQSQGKLVTVLIRLFAFLRNRGKNTFLEAMQRSDITIYSGHGRYGSGPDFYNKGSAAGKLWINPNLTVLAPGAKKMYDFLHQQKVEQPLATHEFNDKYKLWFFDGCNTAHYMIPIRNKYNISHKTTDVIAWKKEVYVAHLSDDVKSFIQEILQGNSLQQIISKLNDIQKLSDRERKRLGRKAEDPTLHGEGFGDNPERSK